MADGETNDQRQQREHHNVDQAQRCAHKEEELQRGLHPQNLNNAFDMVGNQKVFKTLSANMVVLMANLERLLDTREYQDA